MHEEKQCVGGSGGEVHPSCTLVFEAEDEKELCACRRSLRSRNADRGGAGAEASTGAKRVRRQEHSSISGNGVGERKERGLPPIYLHPMIVYTPPPSEEDRSCLDRG